MSKKTYGLIIAALLASSSSHAGSHECEGTIKVGEVWTTIIGKTGSYAPNGCRFKTASKLGGRILKVCPDKTECVIYLPLGTTLDKGAPEPEPDKCDAAKYGHDACWEAYKAYLDSMAASRPIVTITTNITGVERTK